MPESVLTATADADEKQNETDFNSSRDYIYLLRHTSTGNARTAAWLFQVPDSIDPDDVTSAELTNLIGTANSAGTPSGDVTVESDATALAAGLTTRFSAAETENGSVAWDPISVSAAEDATCPDFGTELASALTNSTASGGFYTIAVIWKADIGGPAWARYGTLDHATTPTYSTPQLTITTAAPENFDAEVVDGLVLTEDDLSKPELFSDVDVDFTSVSALGTAQAAGANRLLDVYPPISGVKPSSGWPCVVFVHGGRWTAGDKSVSTSENNLAEHLVKRLTSNGFVCVSVNYRKMQESVNSAAIFRSFPQNVHDVIAGIEYITTNATDYDIDTSKIIYSGFSAGGHLALFAAIAAATNDTSTYTGSQNNAGDRDAGYGYTDSQSPWQFDFDESGELSYTAPAGILLWDAPVDVWELTSIGGIIGDANESAACALLGETTFNASSVNDDEINANDYIAGSGNRFTSAKSAGDLPPIFFMYGTNEDLVENSASIDALETALDAISYDTSTGVGVLNELGGLTKYSSAVNHEDILLGSSLDSEMSWLESILAESALPVILDDTQVAGLKVGEDDVVKIMLGNTELWS